MDFMADMAELALASRLRRLSDTYWQGVTATYRQFGVDFDVRWATINAMKSAFLPFDERLQIINRIIKPGFSMLGADG